MIKLTKGLEPQVLIDNGANWTDILMAKTAANIAPTEAEKTKYRHPSIKQALEIETHGKCAYCESIFGHVHHGDVEHIFPKSEDISKTFLWENLTLACEVCNQNKSNLDPTLKYIIDPYKIDPSEHLTFVGSLVMSKSADFGESTRTILKLDRAKLVERRNERLSKIILIFQTIQHQALPLPAKKAIFQDLINVEIAKTAEYSAMCKAAFNSFLSSLEPQIRGELEQVEQ